MPYRYYERAESNGVKGVQLGGEITNEYGLSACIAWFYGIRYLYESGLLRRRSLGVSWTSSPWTDEFSGLASLSLT